MPKASTVEDAVLERLGRELHEAEDRIDQLRPKLDARLSRLQERGVPIQRLAEIAGLTRQTVYTSIERHRAAQRS